MSKSRTRRAVRQWRTGAGLSLAEAAGKIGVSESLLCRYELGSRALPLGAVGPLAALTGLPVGDLMTDEQRRVYVSIAVPTAAQGGHE